MTEFNWSEFLAELFEENVGKNPNELADIVIKELTDQEKIIAFEHSACKVDVQTRFQQWNATRVRAIVSERAQQNLQKYSVEPSIDNTPTKSVHAGGSVYDAYSELLLAQNTHNTERIKKWVPWGEWTLQDVKCYKRFLDGMVDTYRAKSSWAEEVQKIFEANPEASTLREIYPVVLKRAGAVPKQN